MKTYTISMFIGTCIALDVCYLAGGLWGLLGGVIGCIVAGLLIGKKEHTHTHE